MVTFIELDLSFFLSLGGPTDLKSSLGLCFFGMKRSLHLGGQVSRFPVFEGGKIHHV